MTSTNCYGSFDWCFRAPGAPNAPNVRQLVLTSFSTA